MPNDEDFHLPIPPSPRPTTDQTMTTETSTTTRRPLFPATTAVWRFITRPIRWLWRRKLKITLWLATLITLGWQYENWHGRREYKEQLALFRAEYGDLKWQDFAPPRIPDEENFFAAPVFESFVVEQKPSPPGVVAVGFFGPATDDLREYREKRRALEKEMPHARFLNMKIPEIKTVPCGWVAELPAQEGITFLDLKTWTKEEAKAGRKPPEGMTELQWLRASLPEDETIKGLIAALDRKKACLLPHAADRWAIGEKLNDPAAIPLQGWSGVFDPCRKIALRARAAARSGDGPAARQHCEVVCLLAEGFGNGSSMLGMLVALALMDVANTATTECLASRCWKEADLVILRDRLLRIDEERCLFTGLTLEGFGHHLWPGDIKEWLREGIRRSEVKFGWKAEQMLAWSFANGPDGWIDANFGNLLRSWRSMMIPNGPGDDLLALDNKLSANQPAVMKDLCSGWIKGVPSPRKIVAAIAMPAFSNIARSALERQTRRRQLLLAIAIERHLLAKGSLPQQPADLVPAFIDAIPGDPWQPGTPLRWEVPDKARDPAAPAIRYRILSAGKDTTLGFPEKLP